MRIVIDLQGCQSTGSRNRGIGRYALSLSQAIIRNRGEHEIFIALSGLFPDTIENIRSAFEELLPPDHIRVWYATPPVCELESQNHWRRETAELIREAFLLSLKPDIIYVASLFEGLTDDAVTSIKKFSDVVPIAVTLFDLIPLILKTSYLDNLQVRDWYFNKISYISNADLLLAISESSRQEGIRHLNLSEQRVINISTACDQHFQKKDIPESVSTSVRTQYNLDRPFIMYTGGIDYRKNIEGLIRAFAQLPDSLRKKYQLAIVCSIQTESRFALESLAKEHSIDQGDVIFTGYIPEEDLVVLYNICEVFVFPSWHEGFGLPALEAMSCGAAVIGSNTSSIPEVINLEEALFDPFDDASIADKITQVLTDTNLRKRLIEHGQAQARKFSWDKSARTAIQALESLYKTRLASTSSIDRFSLYQSRSSAAYCPDERTSSVTMSFRNHMFEKLSQSWRDAAQAWNRGDRIRPPKLAFLAPLRSALSSTIFYSAELLPSLSQYYDIEVITDQRNISTPWINEHLTRRSVKYFVKHSEKYDRIVYCLGNSRFYEDLFHLLERIPGVVILHDFFLSEIQALRAAHDAKPNAWVERLYNSHGYLSVKSNFHKQTETNFLHEYPCNFDVFKQSHGVILDFKNSVNLTKSWYNHETLAHKITHVNSHDHYNQLGNQAKKHISEYHSPTTYATAYYQSIEKYYADARNSQNGLINAIGKLSGGPSNDDELMFVATAISKSFPPIQSRKQLFIDISEIIHKDAKSGIQRVTRSILKHLLLNPPSDYRVEPVYATPSSNGYFYARNFTLKFLDCPQDILADTPIEVSPGDIFLGLDLQPGVVAAQVDQLREIANMGVKVQFVVYDLLPVLMPQYFGLGAKALYTKWLKTISRFNGAICISRATAKALKEWYQTNSIENLKRFQINWFHLGADIENSVPTTGLPHNSAQVLARFSDSFTFLMVGTIEPRKRCDLVLSAFDLLWREKLNVNLVLVGKQGWMVESLVELIQNHPEIQQQLFWFQQVSDEYLDEIYTKSTALIIASQGEGFGLPLVEAAQHNLPIIARDIPVFREVAADHAFYFQGASPEALAMDIKYWLNLRMEGRAPSSQGIKPLTWKQSSDQLLSRILPQEEALTQFQR